MHGKDTHADVVLIPSTHDDDVDDDHRLGRRRLNGYCTHTPPTNYRNIHDHDSPHYEPLHRNGTEILNKIK
jgi:hypothetical protein